MKLQKVIVENQSLKQNIAFKEQENSEIRT
jgi:hypothetical protein